MVPITGSSSVREVLKKQLPLIDEQIHQIGRRKRMAAEDLQEFRSFVFLRLTRNDYAVLRKFKGWSCWRNYLKKVICRLALDYCSESWGRWRPSSSAVQFGDLGIRLEMLIERDGYSQSEAIEQLTQESNGDLDREKVELILNHLPNRPRRRTVALETLKHRNDGSSADTETRMGDLRRRLLWIRGRLQKALQNLPPQERLIICLRFEKQMSTAQIARVLGLNQRSAYGLIGRCLRHLRRQLSSDTKEAREIRRLLSSGKSLHQIDESGA